MPRSSTVQAHLARLIPRNESALLCFDDVCNAIDSHKQQYTHHKEQIVRSNNKQSLQNILMPRTSRESSVASDATTQSGITVDRQVWTGYYLLTPSGPEVARDRCRIGHGRKWGDDPNGQVDILLAVRSGYRLRGLHAHIFLNQDGVLLIRANYKNSVLSTDGYDVTLLPQGLALLGRASHLITIGGLLYEFEYNHAQYSQTQQEIFARMRNPPKAIQSHPATLTDNVTVVGAWVIHRMLANTSRGPLRAATDRRGGKLAMVKTIYQKSSNPEIVAGQLNLWTKLMQDISNHCFRFHIVTLVDVFREHVPEYRGDSTIHLLLEPQLMYDMSQIGALRGTAKALTDKQLLFLFYQLVCGISALHDSGWIHRNITLASVGVSSIDPPHVILMDLEDAQSLESGIDGWLPTPGDCGAPNYRAPELEVWSNWYNGGVDVWAAGCLGVEVLLNDVSWKTLFNIWAELPPHDSQYQTQQSKQQAFQRMRSRLSTFPQNSVQSILANMLTFDALTRPGSKDLLGPLEVALNGMQ